MRRVITILATVGIIFSVGFTSAQLVPEKALGATCTVGAVPTAYETQKYCGEWFNISAQDTSPLSIWGAHTPGHTASEYRGVATPLQLQTAIYQDTSVSTCSLAFSIRFKWNGVPGAVGPSQTDKIVEIIPEIFNSGTNPPTKGKKDSISLDFKTKSLGWTVTFLTSSKMTGKNGMNTLSESWDANLAGSAALEKDAAGKSKGAIVASDIQMYQDLSSANFVHYSSTVQFREAHNRRAEQRSALLALPEIWYASDGQFVWTAKKASACSGSAVSISAQYFRTEQRVREACEFQVANFDSLARTIVGWVPLAGTGASLAEIVLGQLTSVKARANSCLDQSGQKSTSFSTTIFP